MTKKKKKPVKKAPTKKNAPKKSHKPVRAGAGDVIDMNGGWAPMAGQPRNPERRYVFRGNVSAFTGSIYRPEHIPMGVAGSCLSVAGGVSRSATGRVDYGNGFVTIGSASTTAEGRIDDLGRAKAWTDNRRKIREDSLPTTTRAGAEVRDFAIRRNHSFAIAVATVTVEGHSPRSGSEPGIPVVRAALEGLAVDGAGITVEFNTEFFQKNDTWSKVRSGIAAHRKTAPRMPPLWERNGAIYGTIVKEMRWSGQAPAGSRIDGNAIIVDDLGTFYIGEIIITDVSRRLTLFRAELGSPDGGSGGGGDIDMNGGWAP
jgi:hypothetical protein